MAEPVSEKTAVAAAPDVVSPVEAPASKDADGENFPVGSFLISAELRPAVAAYYAFARAIDDIADSPDLSPDEKIARLDGFDKAVQGQNDAPGFEKGRNLGRVLMERGVDLACARDLTVAFKQDAIKGRYADWGELANYCRYSANPVGRFLIDLHGEGADAYAPSDALCTALQVLNHLQDCGDDLREIDRVYVPADWMAEEGSGVDDLRKPALTKGLRRTLDRMLDECERLLEIAGPLPAKARDRRFAMECGTIVALGARLTALLRDGDPLATRVALSKRDFAAAGLRGVLQGVFGKRPPRRPAAPTAKAA